MTPDPKRQPKGSKVGGQFAASAYSESTLVLDGPSVGESSQIVTDGIGTERWYAHGRLHREGGPAVIVLKNGTREWWLDGMLHRVGGPAIECDVDHSEYWYEDGLLHRVDGPAAIDPNGDLSWYDRGELILKMTAENRPPQSTG